MSDYIKRNFKNSDISEEAIHNKRVLFRKIETITYIKKDKKLFLETKKSKRNFQCLGKIRDLQIGIEKIKELELGNPKFEMFRHYLETRLSKEFLSLKKNKYKFKRNFLKEANKDFENITFKRIDRKLRKLKGETLRNFKKVDKNQLVLHDIRKIFKKIRYCLEIAFEKRFASKKQVNKAKKIQTLLGEYIDSLTLYTEFCEFTKQNKKYADSKIILLNFINTKLSNIINRKEEILKAIINITAIQELVIESN